MKEHVVTLVLALMVLVSAAHKMEVKGREDDKTDDDEDVDEWDASEEELWGPHEQRHLGINVLDREGKVVVSDPTDRVLRALVKPDLHTHNALTLEKVKALYQKLEAAEREAELDSSSSKDNHLQEILAREQQAYDPQQKGQPEEDSLVKRVLSVFW